MYVLVHIYWNRCFYPNYELLTLHFSKHIRYYSNINMHCIRKYQKNQIPLENSNSFYDLAQYYKGQVFDWKLKFSYLQPTMVVAEKKSITFHISVDFLNC